MIWYRTRPDAGVVERAAFFIAAGLLTWAVWHVSTLAGFYFGAIAPDYLALEFSAPIAFLALAAPVLVDRPSWTAAGVATAVTLLFHDLPYNLNVIVAGAAGIGAGYLADRAAEQRAAREKDASHE